MVPVSGSSYPSLQALGFQKPDRTIRCYFHRGTVDSETVIEAIDHFAFHLRRPITLVIDHSRVYTSAKFNARLGHWKARKLTYSPELNGIEGLSKKLKYQWIPTGAWDTFKDLLENATHCVEQHGIPYIMPSLQN